MMSFRSGAIMMKMYIPFLVNCCLLLLASCAKTPQSYDIEGYWRASHEEWIVNQDGEVNSYTYDYDPFVASRAASIQLVRLSEDVFSIVYNDRFLSKLYTSNPEWCYIRGSVRLIDNKLSGDMASTWEIISCSGDNMTVKYDSGVVKEELYHYNMFGEVVETIEYSVRRQCDFTFRRTQSVE